MQSSVKEAIFNRMKLYKSLKCRGLMADDAVLKGLDGSVYASIASYIKDSDRMYPEMIAMRADDWFSVASMIYEDSTLSQPKGWGEFLKAIKQISMNPEAHMSFRHKVEQGIIDYPTELMAVDVPSNPDMDRGGF